MSSRLSECGHFTLRAHKGRITEQAPLYWFGLRGPHIQMSTEGCWGCPRRKAECTVKGCPQLHDQQSRHDSPQELVPTLPSTETFSKRGHSPCSFAADPETENGAHTAQGDRPKEGSLSQNARRDEDMESEEEAEDEKRSKCWHERIENIALRCPSSKIEESGKWY